MFSVDKTIKKIIGTKKPYGGKNDWDGDGVFNKKDCQPRNTMRQDLSKQKDDDEDKYIIRSPTKQGAVDFFKKQGFNASSESVETLAPPPGDDLGGVFKLHPHRKKRRYY